MKLRFLLIATFVSSIFNLIFYCLFTRSKFFSEVLFVRGSYAILYGFLICWISLIFIFYFIYKKRFFESVILNFYSSALPSISILLFHSLILVSLERSITVYSLSYLDLYYSKNQFTKNDLNEIISQNYMSNTNVVNKRIKEQINIGYIEKVNNDQYRLTDKAKNFLKKSRFLAKIFNLKTEFLWPRI